MTSSIIYLHEEALRLSHPVFKQAPCDSRIIFIWDDHYFRTLNYSLKRLVFIYETLCTLPIDIILGPTQEVLREINPEVIYTPLSNHPDIVLAIEKMSEVAMVKVIADDAFCEVDHHDDLTRFSRYWKKAQQSVFDLHRK